MQEFEENIIGLVQHCLMQAERFKHREPTDAFGNLDDYELRIHMPRGFGNTSMALILLTTFADSFLIVSSRLTKQYTLELFPRPSDGFSELSGRISTASEIDRPGGSFLVGASVARLADRRAQIVITDDAELSPAQVLKLFKTYRISLLVRLG